MQDSAHRRSADENRRSSPRLTLKIPVAAAWIGSDRPIDIESENLSWGGVRFTTDDPIIQAVDHLKLVFPWRGDQSFSASVEVVHRERLPDGRMRIGARFASMSRSDEHRLERLLLLMTHCSSHQDGTTSEPAAPMTETLELECLDEADMRDRLSELASGRLSLVVFKGYRDNQSILLTITGAEPLPGFQFRARILAQEAQAFPNAKGKLIKLDLALEHPPEELKPFARLVRHDA